MKRREFMQISAITGATAALAGCGHPEHQLIRFVPEEDLVPGVAEWKPSISPACGAGCGILARVMEGEAEVVWKNQLGLIRMGLAKKLEGNPEHPVSRGKLCPRGQAAIPNHLPSGPHHQSAQARRRARLRPIPGNHLGGRAPPGNWRRESGSSSLRLPS